MIVQEILGRILKNERMKKIFSILLLPWISCWAFLATIFLAILVVIGGTLDSSGNFAFNLSKLWSRIILATSFVKVRIEGRNRIKKGQVYVIVANHQSYYDIPAILIALDIQFRWVITQGIRKIPLFGWALSSFHNIFVDRSNPFRAMKSIYRGMAHLPQGVSIMIFPEGGLTVDESVRPFKEGGFMMAVEKGWPVLPVAVTGSRTVYSTIRHGVSPGTIRVEIGDPIDVTPYNHDSLKMLAERARETIFFMLQD